MFNKNKTDIRPRAVIERDLAKYEINTMPYGEDTSHVEQLTDEIIQTLRDNGVTYREAMQIPAQLKARLSLAFQEQMLDALVCPLSERPNQSHK